MSSTSLVHQQLPTEAKSLLTHLGFMTLFPFHIPEFFLFSHLPYWLHFLFREEQRLLLWWNLQVWLNSDFSSRTHLSCLAGSLQEQHSLGPKPLLQNSLFNFLMFIYSADTPSKLADFGSLHFLSDLCFSLWDLILSSLSIWQQAQHHPVLSVTLPITFPLDC